jgi:hypothetical protein
VATETRTVPEGFRELQWFAYTGIYVVFDVARSFAYTGFDDFEKFRFAGKSHSEIQLFALQLLLFLVLAFWSARWIEATRHEMDIWLEAGIQADKLTSLISGAVLGTALYLGLALAFVGNVTLICGFFCVVAACNIATVGMANAFFAEHLPMAAFVPKSLLRYWDCDDTRRVLPPWKSRQVWRLVTMCLVACTATIMAFKSEAKTAYAILIANIIAAEAVIWRWRVRRDREALKERNGTTAQRALAPVRPAVADTPGIRTMPVIILAWCLAGLPFLSFAGQFFFSRRDGTLLLMLHHPTVTYVDWVLAPFNFAAVKAIDWSKGTRIFLIAVISVSLTLATHAFWQAEGLDPGHMITTSGIVLPAGWVHIGFSIVEMVLLCAFVFCRLKSSKTALRAATIYFFAMFAAGLWIHRKLVVTDACVLVAGLFFLYAYPWLLAKSRKPQAAPSTA